MSHTPHEREQFTVTHRRHWAIKGIASSFLLPIFQRHSHKVFPSPRNLFAATVMGAFWLSGCNPEQTEPQKTLFVGDTIHFVTDISYPKPAAGIYGVLIDGVKDGLFLNDYVPRRGDAVTDLQIGNFTSFDTSVIVRESGPGEIIAFTRRHPPTLLRVNWTPSADHVDLAFQKRYSLPLAIWIISGDADQQRQNAVLACAMTAKIWNAERQGFILSSCTIDANHQDPNLKEFRCTATSINNLSNGRIIANAINVYYVEKVFGEVGGGFEDSNGINCGAMLGPQYKHIIVMGSGTSAALLTHELGHSLGLGHVDGYSEFDNTNVMHNESDHRKFFTEGQTFRQVYQPESAVHDIYKQRLESMGITLQDRFCPDILGRADEDWVSIQMTFQCPLLQLRLWSDKKPLFREYVPISREFFINTFGRLDEDS